MRETAVSHPPVQGGRLHRTHPLISPNMSRPTVLFGFAIALAACHGGSAKPPEPLEHSLSGLAAQHVALLPTYAVRVAPELGWSIGRPADVQQLLDTDIAAALDERGIKRAWIMPDDLAQDARRNPTYAADPRTLAEEPLRSPALAIDMRLPEPLASQIRTLVAFRQDTRLVLAPVELRFEPAGAGRGRGVLRLVLIDARSSNVRWIGTVGSDTASAFGPSITATLAARLASIISP